MCGWFIVGLVTFQIRGFKSFLEEISDFSDVITYLSLVFGIFYGTLTLPNVFVGFIKSIIIGFQTMFIYLIGANISRCYQFGVRSDEIVGYILRIGVYILMFAILFEALEVL